MQFVTQQNRSSGCGIACVAMISGKTYDQVRQLMFPDGRKRNFYTDWNDIKSALDKLNIRRDKRPFSVKNWESIDSRSIVACSKKKSGNWHWVVVDKGQVFDPLKSEPVSRSRRIPFSFLRIK